VRVVIRGHHLPGRRIPHGDGWYDNVHVALQVGREPQQATPADAARAQWVTDIDVINRNGERDFRGTAVQGKRGERFLYLTWGDVDDNSFRMFRRAKLMVDDLFAAAADADAEVIARVDLTDEYGMPRCARLRAPTLEITSG
jgi:Family of unknown function (DUF5990)